MTDYWTRIREENDRFNAELLERERNGWRPVAWHCVACGKESLTKPEGGCCAENSVLVPAQSGQLALEVR